MFKVVAAPLKDDLSEFTRKLWDLKITHRVVFETEQVLLVDNEQQIELVSHLYQYWQQHGHFPENIQEQYSTAPFIQSINLNNKAVRAKVDLKKIPLVLTLLSISLILSLLTDFGSELTLLKSFTITDFQYLNGQVNYYSLDQNFTTFELWRFLSPIFIHFNVPHILFNSLWIWVVGSVIEQRHTSYVLLLITLVSGISSNIAQYYVSGPIFGGLSGVVYAVISYAWLWDRFNTDKLRVVSNALMGFMVVWLVLGYSGILTQLGLGSIANTAHLVGLLSGFLSMFLVHYFKKVIFRNK